MMPCIDMANHASGDATAALYETDGDGNGLLLLREGKAIEQGGEVTITCVAMNQSICCADDCRYGDDKGACENIFSYGFLEDGMTSAKVLFLDLEIPDDDPLRPAKMYVSTEAPGFRIFEKDGAVDWEGDFIWLVVVNEEDGLDFKIRQTTDGRRDIQSVWKDGELDTSKLRSHLEKEETWDVFQLRATVLLQNRIDAQIEMLQETKHVKRETSVRETPWRLSERLRSLELNLLQRAAAAFDEQVRTTLFPLHAPNKSSHGPFAACSLHRPFCGVHASTVSATCA